MDPNANAQSTHIPAAPSTGVPCVATLTPAPPPPTPPPTVDLLGIPMEEAERIVALLGKCAAGTASQVYSALNRVMPVNWRAVLYNGKPEQQRRISYPINIILPERQ